MFKKKLCRINVKMEERKRVQEDRKRVNRNLREFMKWEGIQKNPSIVGFHL